MVIHTFIDKNNTIVFNSSSNTGLNPVSELTYGGMGTNNIYSRLLLKFDVNRLKSLYTGGTFTDLSKLTHKLKITNTGAFDQSLLNTLINDKVRASSFNLIAFKIPQAWDEGVGYDYTRNTYIAGDTALSYNPSNWFYAQTNSAWTNGTGIYSGSTSGVTIATQHFDKGNENISLDITSYVNDLLTGATNNGLAIAFSRDLETMETDEIQYVGFFTRHTQTIYEPFVETIYNHHILDDRNKFFLDKVNKLYLYVNIGGVPTNLDNLPTVEILDNSDSLIQSFSTAEVTHVTKGIYSIDLQISTTADYIDSTMFSDLWSDISINGIERPPISLNFALKASEGYYNIGNNDSLPKSIGVNISGLRNKENIKRGDARKVLVSARIPYTVEQPQCVNNLMYRIYTREGMNELTIIDYHPVEMANNHYYFILDTLSLLPTTYFLDIKIESNLEVTTLTNVVSFDIVSESNIRYS